MIFHVFVTGIYGCGDDLLQNTTELAILRKCGCDIGEISADRVAIREKFVSIGL